jgi:hypothetical protein
MRSPTNKAGIVFGRNHTFNSPPRQNVGYIFTLKYNNVSNTLSPFAYDFGIEVWRAKNAKMDSCSVHGRPDYKISYFFKSKNEVIQSIKLLHKCFENTKTLHSDEKYKGKLSDTKIKKITNKNPTLKIWVDYILYTNN